MNDVKTKPYYLLKVVSSDLVFYSFEESYKTKKEALKALEEYKLKYKVKCASIRHAKDVLNYEKST